MAVPRTPEALLVDLPRSASSRQESQQPLYCGRCGGCFLDLRVMEAFRASEQEEAKSFSLREFHWKQEPTARSGSSGEAFRDCLHVPKLL